MTTFVKNAEAKDLTGRDISAALNDAPQQVLYSDITTIDAMLGARGCYVMLYQFPGQSLGHWVCGFLLQGKLHTFDPYGLQPDEPMEMMGSAETRYKDAIESSKYYPDHVLNNRFAYQKLKSGIDTCGRHVIARLLFRMMDNEEYHTLMMGRIGRTPDERVTLLTLASTMS